MSDDPKTISSIVLSTSTASIAFGSAAFAFSPPKVEVPPPTHQIYSLVGRIASDWAHVEHTFDLIIWDLAGIDPEKGACITAQLGSINARCKTIIAQLKLWGRTWKVETEELVKKTNEISGASHGPGEKRNRAVHDPWFVYTQTAKIGHFKAMAPKDYRYGVHPVDLEILEDTLRSIAAFSERVSGLKNAIFEMKRTTPTIPAL